MTMPCKRETVSCTPSHVEDLTAIVEPAVKQLREALEENKRRKTENIRCQGDRELPPRHSEGCK